MREFISIGGFFLFVRVQMGQDIVYRAKGLLLGSRACHLRVQTDVNGKTPAGSCSGPFIAIFLNMQIETSPISWIPIEPFLKRTSPGSCSLLADLDKKSYTFS